MKSNGDVILFVETKMECEIETLNEVKKKTIIPLFSLLVLCSCAGWLDKEPLAQMSPGSFFSNENELQAFSNGFYTIFPGSGIYSENYDLCLSMECPAEMREGRTVPASGGGWDWSALRNFNTLLE